MSLDSGSDSEWQEVISQLRAKLSPERQHEILGRLRDYVTKAIALDEAREQLDAADEPPPPDEPPTIA